MISMDGIFMKVGKKDYKNLPGSEKLSDAITDDYVAALYS